MRLTISEFNRKKCIMALFVLLVSVVFSIALAALVGSNTKQLVKNFIYGRDVSEKVIGLEQIQAVNYSVEGSDFISVTGDSQLIVENLNCYVETVTVHFQEKVTDAIEVEMFYSTKEGVFSQDKVIPAAISEGQIQLVIGLGQDVSGLRLDIGTKEGVRFRMDKICVNEGMKALSIGQLWECMKVNISKKVWFDRFWMILFLCIFAGSHIIFDIRKMYQTIFHRRWVIAGLLLLFLVVNKYHGDSIAMYDAYVQPGMGSEYVQPVFGKARPIRSDEWMVDRSVSLSTQWLEDPYGKYNDIVRGTNTVNSNQLSFNKIFNVFSLAGLLINKCFGYEYFYSYGWYLPIFLTFLFNIEFFLILTDRKKILSVCGSCMIIFSAFFQWWGFPCGVVLYPVASLVCAYYYVESKKTLHKVFFGYGTAVFAANYIISLYPAWQVPMGYVSLVLLIWLIAKERKNLKNLSKGEIIGIVCAFAFCSILTGTYLYDQKEYTSSITATEYPGARVDYGGNNTVYKLFHYIPGVLYAFRDIGNPSEAGTFISFFPIPLLIGCCAWLKDKIYKNKKNGIIVGGLLLVSFFLLWYNVFGLPPVLAKVTLMTYCTSFRAIDLVGYISVILFVIFMSQQEYRIDVKKALAVSLPLSFGCVYYEWQYHAGYMNKIFTVVMFAFLFFVIFALISKCSKRMIEMACICVILFSLVTGGYVRPVAKGTDAVYSKPAAHAIIDIVSADRHAKWFTYGSLPLSAFSIACGAPTINSTNTYPNMELWRKLDSEGKYNEVYNRYVHILVDFVDTDTTMELVQADLMQLHLSYKDIEKTEAKYIFATSELDVDNEFVFFEKLYEEGGSYIYQVHLK